ncbi:hypothetical protein SAMN02990966_06720 [Rhodospirillales bacterium URHD0017]|nr:hypothetical protein SAMN02990966_06720 [Rhodospirillales bacterium URHD0017]
MDDAQVSRMLRSGSSQARVDAVRYLVRHNPRLEGSSELRKLLADAFAGDGELRSEGTALVLTVPHDEFIGLYRSMMTSQDPENRQAALQGADPWLHSGVIAKPEMCALIENSLGLADPWTRFLAAAQLARLCGGGRNAWSAAADAIVAAETPPTPWWRTIRSQAEEFLQPWSESYQPLNEELVRRGAAPLEQPKARPGDSNS